MPVLIKKLDKNIEKSVFDALTEINYIPKKKKVFIKPNIVNPFKPEEAFITNPRVVSGVIDYLRSKNIDNIVSLPSASM